MRKSKQGEPHAKCGAKTRNGKLCQHAAGARTNHPGQGRCWLHGGATPIKHGRYSTIRRPRIRELLDEYDTDPDPMNLEPEVKLLRALLTDFVERYDETTEAVLAWHNSFGDEYRKAFDVWRERMIRHAESGDWQDAEADDLPDPPDPLEHMNKPRQMLDVTAAASLVDKVGRMVERIEKIRAEGTISLVEVNTILKQVGIELAAAVREEVTDEATQDAVLRAFESKWKSIAVTSRGHSGGYPAGRQVN
jgi:hypothetical protein